MAENVDLDLLSLFPQKGARIIGGKGRKQAQRGQQWGEELARNGCGERRKKTPFYRSPRIQPLAAHQPRYYRTACGTTVERYYLNGSGTTALRYYRGSLPCLLPPLTEGFAVVGAVVATVLPPGGTTALPGGTTAQAKTAQPKQA